MSDYVVGRGKPPRETQFKPGNQAARGKRGRRKASAGPSVEELVAKIINTRRRVRRGDGSVEMSTLELALEQLAQKAMKGDHRAIETLLGLADKFTPQALRATLESPQITFHNAPGSEVRLPPASLWEPET